jgi:hypothetical protein
MWKILKAEIEHNKYYLLPGLLFVFILQVILVISGDWNESQNDFPGLRVIWFSLSIFIVFLYLLSFRKDKRLRIHTMLPINPRKIASVRISVFILFWIVLILILFLFHLINQGQFPGPAWIYNILTLTGLVFIINSLPYFSQDIFNIYFSKKSRVLLSIALILCSIIYIILVLMITPYFDTIDPQFFNSYRNTVQKVYFSPAVTIISPITGITLLIASLFLFNRRKSYLE